MLEDLATLALKLDEAFEEIRARNPSAMECRIGCTDCCRCRLSVTHVEAAFLRQGLARLPRSVRLDLARRAVDSSREMCPGLDDEGSCEIHALRPIICRSYGAPLREQRPVQIIAAPTVDVCDKNFVGVDKRTLPEEDILDQTGLTGALGEINAAYCAANDLPMDERIPLAQILAHCV